MIRNPCNNAPMSTTAPAPSPSAAPQRHIPLQGASNFRDLGGYTTSDGRRVRWRRLFRSDRLSSLSQEDVRTLQALGVRHSIDFRGDAERLRNDYEIEQLTRIAIPIEPQVVQSLQGLLAQGAALDGPSAHHLMEQTYAAFVEHNAPQFRAFFDVLLQHEGPFVFHCTAGKDRTGFAAALLLEALGVAREAIMDDYLLTNALYQPPTYKPSGSLPESVLQVLWRVTPNFLQAAQRQIEAEHGSVAQYLREVLGLGPDALAQLKALYLEP